MQIGDVVKHFKYETLSDEEKRQNKYVYCIRGFAEHSETGESLVIYQAMYAPFKMYARPLSMFFGEVDHQKYPDIQQRNRFEVYTLQ